jgi:hypothetical protein
LRQREIVDSLAEALRHLRFAFPDYANSRYASGFIAIDTTPSEIERACLAGSEKNGLTKLWVGLDSIRGLFPGNAGFQNWFQQADMLLDALLKLKSTSDPS